MDARSYRRMNADAAPALRHVEPLPTPTEEVMDKQRFEAGLAKRKSTLGAAYVEDNLAAADDFARPFQEAMTEWCWGFG